MAGSNSADVARFHSFQLLPFNTTHCLFKRFFFNVFLLWNSSLETFAGKNKETGFYFLFLKSYMKFKLAQILTLQKDFNTRYLFRISDFIFKKNSGFTQNNLISGNLTWHLWIHLYSPIDLGGGRRWRGVMVNVLDCNTVVSEFENQSYNYVHVRTNTLRRVWTFLSRSR